MLTQDELVVAVLRQQVYRRPRLMRLQGAEAVPLQAALRRPLHDGLRQEVVGDPQRRQVRNQRGRVEGGVEGPP